MARSVEIEITQDDIDKGDLSHSGNAFALALKRVFQRPGLAVGANYVTRGFFVSDGYCELSRPAADFMWRLLLGWEVEPCWLELSVGDNW